MVTVIQLIVVVSSLCTENAGLAKGSSAFSQAPELSNYWIDVFGTLGGFASSGVLVISMLALMPQSEHPVRQAGERTLTPYVFHYLVLLFLRSYTNFMDDRALVNGVLVLLIVVCATLTLFSPPVHNIFKHIVMPPLDKMGLFSEPSKGYS